MSQNDNQATITSVTARRIWDSRGRPTIECEVETEGGAVGRGIAPAGASMGSREAVERRDGGNAFGGKDVQGALTDLRREIAPLLVGRLASDQAGIDAAMRQLDGTPTLSRLGGNAVTAASLAVLHAAAASRGLPLWQHLAKGSEVRMPLPEIQIFGGGAHAGRRVDIQDFMVMAPKAECFAHALEITAEVYLAAGKLMAARGALQGVADEGGYWPVFASNEEALDMLLRAIETAGFTPGDEVHISLDIAASEFGRDGRYTLGLEQRTLGRGEWLAQLLDWCRRYPILSIEDPCGEDDVEGMRAFTAEVGQHIQVIGDDYLVTNAELVAQAARDRTCNAVLIKVNQAGTVSDALAALAAGQAAGFGTIVSARSGETEDTTIVDLAIGCNAGQLKVGSFSRSERMAKWNAALRIEERLKTGAYAAFAGFAGGPMGSMDRV